MMSLPSFSSLFTASFAASYLFIMLKALQQLHVQHAEYWKLLPTSLAMTLCEVFVVANVAKQGFGWLVLPIGVGSGLGAMTAVWLHKRMRRTT